jgi:hypothetical protein
MHDILLLSAVGDGGTNFGLSWLIQITSTVEPTKKSNMGPGEVQV